MNSQNVFEILKKLSEEGTTIIVATHDMSLASKIHRIVKVIDGQL